MSKQRLKSPTPKKQKQKVKEIKTRMKLLPILLGICTLVGGAVVFLPRPMVLPPSVPLDQKDQFSVSFDVSNSGYIPLTDCTASLGVGQITTQGAHLDPKFIPTFESRLVMPAWQNHKLSMDERFTIVLSDILRPVESADIAIIVSYKPWILPIHREKMFRFVTFKQTNGHQYWRSWPIDEPLPPVQ
jgi:hypothetical protein